MFQSWLSGDSSVTGDMLTQADGNSNQGIVPAGGLEEVVLESLPVSKAVTTTKVVGQVGKETVETMVIGLQKEVSKYIGKNGYNIFKPLFASLRNVTKQNMRWLDKGLRQGQKILVKNTPQEAKQAVKDGVSKGGLQKEFNHLWEKFGTKTQRQIEGIDP